LNSPLCQWTWEELHYNGQILNVSKRHAYLRYLELPRLLRCRLELAANIGRADPFGDASKLRSNGWTIVDPREVASSPERYHQYIRESPGEFMCPKPIHVALKTGWFSDRSLAYLAIGQPVAAEETSFSKRILRAWGYSRFMILRPRAAIADIDANYERRQRAAREIVEAHFNWRTTVGAILAACNR
jgi:hypothetical protein